MDKLFCRGYNIGGVQFNVTAPDYEDSAELAVFRHDSESCDVRYDFRFVRYISEPTLPLVFSDSGRKNYSDGVVDARTYIDSDGGILMKITGDGKHFDVEFDAAHPDYFGSHVVLKAMDIPRLMLGRGGVFLHASLVKFDGRAILFTADKQVGKSTQAALWEKHLGAEVINGDRALISQRDGVWTAFGSPYCGTSEICKNDSAPICAIVILGQSDTTTLRRASVSEAVAAMLSGASYDIENKNETEKCFDLCAQLVSNVPFYKLDCTPDFSAVKALHDAITEI